MNQTRPLRVVLSHPGASWSTHDVYEGILYGLLAHGVEVFSYRLDERLESSKRTLWSLYRIRRKRKPDLPKPTKADIAYHASAGLVERALAHQADIVLFISATFLHPNVLPLFHRSGLQIRTFVLFTESPYDIEPEKEIAKLVDGCWTTERTSVADLRSVNPCSGYLRHGWHPLKHGPHIAQTFSMPAHDVVFVGSGFPERISWFNKIDWTGIDLGLYGTWTHLGLKPEVEAMVRGGPLDNIAASDLYRRAKIGLNLYRRSKGFSLKRKAGWIDKADSLSPRAYELAACGVFHLSEYRAEVPEVFGDLVPTFTTAEEAETLIRDWLPRESDRAAIAAQLPAVVAEASWEHRASTVLADLARLISAAA